jgi:hypothetical protein
MAGLERFKPRLRQPGHRNHTALAQLTGTPLATLTSNTTALVSLRDIGATEVTLMKTPSIGQLILARNLLTTGMSFRRRTAKTPPVFYRVGELAIVLTFVYFLFM